MWFYNERLLAAVTVCPKSRKMKVISTIVALASATKECNGPRYKPLGCFDDLYPHPEKMPQAIKLVHPTFKLTNMAYENIEIDWENPPIQRFNPLLDVVVMGRVVKCR